MAFFFQKCRSPKFPIPPTLRPLIRGSSELDVKGKNGAFCDYSIPREKRNFPVRAAAQRGEIKKKGGWGGGGSSAFSKRKAALLPATGLLREGRGGAPRDARTRSRGFAPCRPGAATPRRSPALPCPALPGGTAASAAAAAAEPLFGTGAGVAGPSGVSYPAAVRRFAGIAPGTAPGRPSARRGRPHRSEPSPGQRGGVRRCRFFSPPPAAPSFFFFLF